VASAHSYLAFVSWLQRDFARATGEASTALAMFRELGDVEGAAWSLISLGTVARYQGEAERAAALLADSRALSEGIGFREGIAWCRSEQIRFRGSPMLRRRTPGLSTPGLSTPGLSTLGLSTLGLSTLGLSTLGLSTLGLSKRRPSVVRPGRGLPRGRGPRRQRPGLRQTGCCGCGRWAPRRWSSGTRR
jgi:hypothetical protein